MNTVRPLRRRGRTLNMNPLLPLFFLLSADTVPAQDTLEPVVVVATRIPSRHSDLPLPVDLLAPGDLNGTPGDLALIGGFPVSYGPPWTLQTASLLGSRSSDVQVLVNGFPYHPPQGESVDLSTLPWEIVQQVEVLKSGASSLYGGQALVGVVNAVVRPNPNVFGEWTASPEGPWFRTGWSSGHGLGSVEGGTQGRGARFLWAEKTALLEAFYREIQTPAREGFPQEARQEDVRLWGGKRFPWGDLTVLVQSRGYRSGPPFPDTARHTGGVVDLYHRALWRGIAFFQEGLVRGVMSSEIGQRIRGEVRAGVTVQGKEGYGELAVEGITLPPFAGLSARISRKVVVPAGVVFLSLFASRKAPTLDDLFWPRTAFAEGNPDLRPEFAWGGEVVWLRSLLVVRGFARWMEGLIIWAPEEGGVWRPRNSGFTRHAGVDVSVKQGGLSFHATLSRHRDTEGRRLPYRPEILYALQWNLQRTPWVFRFRLTYTGIRSANRAATRLLPPRLDCTVDLRWSRGRWDLDVRMERLFPSLQWDGYVDNTRGLLEGYPLRGPVVTFRLSRSL